MNKKKIRWKKYFQLQVFFLLLFIFKVVKNFEEMEKRIYNFLDNEGIQM